MYLYHCFFTQKKIESWYKRHSYIPTISKKQMYYFIEAVLNTTFNCLKTLSSPIQMNSIFGRRLAERFVLKLINVIQWSWEAVISLLTIYIYMGRGAYKVLIFFK